jgi:hypothetical protein
MVIASRPQASSNWLAIAERASLAGTIITGAIASVASQSLGYTLAPLSLSLVLGLVNRQRLEQMVQQSNTPIITQVDPKLSQDVKLLSEQVRALHKQVHALPPDVWAEAQQTMTPVVRRMETLESATAQLRSQIDQFQLNPQSHDLGSLQQSAEELNAKFNKLKLRLQIVGHVDSEIKKLEQKQKLLEQSLGKASSVLESAIEDQQGSDDQENQSDDSLPTSNGFERAVFRRLNQSSQVQQNQWLVLHEYDVASRSRDDLTQHADFIVISDHCIFVLEVKRCSGKIKPDGNDVSNNPWLCCSGNSETGERIKSFWGCNPYRQVHTYRNSLRDRLRGEILKHCETSVWSDIPVYGIVVFQQGADISSLGSQMPNFHCIKIVRSHYVTTLDRLMRTLKNLEEDTASRNSSQNPTRLSAKQIESLLRGRLA